ncbi:MAG: inorganic phosphate transporter [Bradyrhizobium sp.]|nr:inorganic phosphate transporter [Bradyrhizobium sp.]
MLASLAPGSAATIAVLVGCFILVLFFEFSNGFHDTANAVATVIYTNSLRPVAAVIWSGIMNFIGVIVGGIAVAYALVELIPPEVLSPPDGNLAAGMLVAVFAAALLWNIGTWWLGIPNSSSHALIGALIGIAIENSFVGGGGGGVTGVDWGQVWGVLGSLLVSPILGFVLALGVFLLFRQFIRQRQLFRPPEGDKPPVWWMRLLLVLTCTGVSFAHGTNDGQKSIGLIMLTIIGLMPASYALNLEMTHEQIERATRQMQSASELIERAGGARKQQGLSAARALLSRFAPLSQVGDIPAGERPAVRNDLNQTLASLREVKESSSVPEADRKSAKSLHDELMRSVQYAPWWVRILSALCLGIGTMVGYRRIVKTLGERLGKSHLVPAQGASAELVAAGLISFAGFTGYPVSTTHVVTGGIAGTMVGSGAGIQRATLWMIAAAWVLTLPATIALSCGIFYCLS